LHGGNREGDFTVNAAARPQYLLSGDRCARRQKGRRLGDEIVGQSAMGQITQVIFGSLALGVEWN